MAIMKEVNPIESKTSEEESIDRSSPIAFATSPRSFSLPVPDYRAPTAGDNAGH